MIAPFFTTNSTSRTAAAHTTAASNNDDRLHSSPPHGNGKWTHAGASPSPPPSSLLQQQQQQQQQQEQGSTSSAAVTVNTNTAGSDCSSGLPSEKQIGSFSASCTTGAVEETTAEVDRVLLHSRQASSDGATSALVRSPHRKRVRVPQGPGGVAPAAAPCTSLYRVCGYVVSRQVVLDPVEGPLLAVTYKPPSSSSATASGSGSTTSPAQKVEDGFPLLCSSCGAWGIGISARSAQTSASTTRRRTTDAAAPVSSSAVKEEHNVKRSGEEVNAATTRSADSSVATASAASTRDKRTGGEPSSSPSITAAATVAPGTKTFALCMQELLREHQDRMDGVVHFVLRPPAIRHVSLRQTVTGFHVGAEEGSGVATPLFSSGLPTTGMTKLPYHPLRSPTSAALCRAKKSRTPTHSTPPCPPSGTPNHRLGDLPSPHFPPKNKKPSKRGETTPPPASLAHDEDNAHGEGEGSSSDLAGAGMLDADLRQQLEAKLGAVYFPFPGYHCFERYGLSERGVTGRSSANSRSCVCSCCGEPLFHRSSSGANCFASPHGAATGASALPFRFAMASSRPLEAAFPPPEELRRWCRRPSPSGRRLGNSRTLQEERGIRSMLTTTTTKKERNGTGNSINMKTVAQRGFVVHSSSKFEKEQEESATTGDDLAPSLFFCRVPEFRGWWRKQSPLLLHAPPSPLRFPSASPSTATPPPAGVSSKASSLQTPAAGVTSHSGPPPRSPGRALGGAVLPSPSLSSSIRELEEEAQDLNTAAAVVAAAAATLKATPPRPWRSTTRTQSRKEPKISVTLKEELAGSFPAASAPVPTSLTTPPPASSPVPSRFTGFGSSDSSEARAAGGRVSNLSLTGFLSPLFAVFTGSASPPLSEALISPGGRTTPLPLTSSLKDDASDHSSGAGTDGALLLPGAATNFPSSPTPSDSAALVGVRDKNKVSQPSSVKSATTTTTAEVSPPHSSSSWKYYTAPSLDPAAEPHAATAAACKAPLPPPAEVEYDADMVRVEEEEALDRQQHVQLQQLQQQEKDLRERRAQCLWIAALLRRLEEQDRLYAPGNDLGLEDVIQSTQKVFVEFLEAFPLLGVLQPQVFVKEQGYPSIAALEGFLEENDFAKQPRDVGEVLHRASPLFSGHTDFLSGPIPSLNENAPQVGGDGSDAAASPVMCDVHHPNSSRESSATNRSDTQEGEPLPTFLSASPQSSISDSIVSTFDGTTTLREDEARNVTGSAPLPMETCAGVSRRLCRWLHWSTPTRLWRHSTAAAHLFHHERQMETSRLPLLLQLCREPIRLQLRCRRDPPYAMPHHDTGSHGMVKDGEHQQQNLPQVPPRTIRKTTSTENRLENQARLTNMVPQHPSVPTATVVIEPLAVTLDRRAAVTRKGAEQRKQEMNDEAARYWSFDAGTDNGVEEVRSARSRDDTYQTNQREKENGRGNGLPELQPDHVLHHPHDWTSCVEHQEREEGVLIFSPCSGSGHCSSSARLNFSTSPNTSSLWPQRNMQQPPPSPSIWSSRGSLLPPPTPMREEGGGTNPTRHSLLAFHHQPQPQFPPDTGFPVADRGDREVEAPQRPSSSGWRERHPTPPAGSKGGGELDALSLRRSMETFGTSVGVGPPTTTPSSLGSSYCAAGVEEAAGSSTSCLPSLSQAVWLGCRPDFLRAPAWRMLCGGYAPAGLRHQSAVLQERRSHYARLAEEYGRPVTALTRDADSSASSSSSSSSSSQASSREVSPSPGQQQHKKKVRKKGVDRRGSIPVVLSHHLRHPQQAREEQQQRLLERRMEKLFLSVTEQRLLTQLLRLDLPRHSSALFHYPPLVRSLSRCVYLWAHRHPAVGYVQGMDDMIFMVFLVFLTDAARQVCLQRGRGLLKLLRMEEEMHEAEEMAVRHEERAAAVPSSLPERDHDSCSTHSPSHHPPFGAPTDAEPMGVGERSTTLQGNSSTTVTAIPTPSSAEAVVVGHEVGGQHHASPSLSHSSMLLMMNSSVHHSRSTSRSIAAGGLRRNPVLSPTRSSTSSKDVGTSPTTTMTPTRTIMGNHAVQNDGGALRDAVLQTPVASTWSEEKGSRTPPCGSSNKATSTVHTPVQTTSSSSPPLFTASERSAGQGGDENNREKKASSAPPPSHSLTTTFSPTTETGLHSEAKGRLASFTLPSETTPDLLRDTLPPTAEKEAGEDAIPAGTTEDGEPEKEGNTAPLRLQPSASDCPTATRMDLPLQERNGSRSLGGRKAASATAAAARSTTIVSTFSPSSLLYQALLPATDDGQPRRGELTPMWRRPKPHRSHRRGQRLSSRAANTGACKAAARSRGSTASISVHPPRRVSLTPPSVAFSDFLGGHQLSYSFLHQAHVFSQDITEELVLSLTEEELQAEETVHLMLQAEVVLSSPATRPPNAEASGCTVPTAVLHPSKGRRSASPSSAPVPSFSFLSHDVLLEVEADTYYCATPLLEALQGNLVAGQAGIQQSGRELEELLQHVHPTLLQSLRREKPKPKEKVSLTGAMKRAEDDEDNPAAPPPPLYMTCFSWFHCLLLRELPLALSLRLWDSFWAMGVAHLIRFHVHVCAALILSMEDVLLYETPSVNQQKSLLSSTSVRGSKKSREKTAAPSASLPPSRRRPASMETQVQRLRKPFEALFGEDKDLPDWRGGDAGRRRVRAYFGWQAEGSDTSMMTEDEASVSNVTMKGPGSDGLFVRGFFRSSWNRRGLSSLPSSASTKSRSSSTSSPPGPPVPWFNPSPDEWWTQVLSVAFALWQDTLRREATACLRQPGGEDP